jgi:hypothetical protein
LAEAEAIDVGSRRDDMGQRLVRRRTFDGEFSDVTRSFDGRAVMRHVW